jgi:hypothetical protein
MPMRAMQFGGDGLQYIGIGAALGYPSAHTGAQARETADQMNTNKREGRFAYIAERVSVKSSYQEILLIRR